MLYLPDIAGQDQQSKAVTLNNRLPNFINSPCQVTATYSVEAEDDYYLIHLRVVGNLNVACQRCMQELSLPYDNATKIAVCRSEERAGQLLERYESMVSLNREVDLEELIIDELHLYVSPFHLEKDDCDSNINKVLLKKEEHQG